MSGGVIWSCKGRVWVSTDGRFRVARVVTWHLYDRGALVDAFLTPEQAMDAAEQRPPEPTRCETMPS